MLRNVFCSLTDRGRRVVAVGGGLAPAGVRPGDDAAAAAEVELAAGRAVVVHAHVRVLGRGAVPREADAVGISLKFENTSSDMICTEKLRSKQHRPA